MTVTKNPGIARRGRRDSAMVLLSFLGASAAVAVLGSLATRDSVQGWYADADKPWFTPPDAVFGPVWTVLYVAMSVAAWLAWKHGAPTGVWWVQLALNLAWTPVFFGLQWLWGGLVVILLLDAAVAATVLVFWRWSRLAGALLLPYLVWVLFATALNTGVALLN